MHLCEGIKFSVPIESKSSVVSDMEEAVVGGMNMSPALGRMVSSNSNACQLKHILVTSNGST